MLYESKSGPTKNEAVKRRKIIEESSSDDEECFCLDVVEPFSNIRPRESCMGKMRKNQQIGP